MVSARPGYKLVQLANGTHSVHSLEYRETFHPVIGPIAEAEALYLRQLRLAERAQSEPGEFVIWDVGLGAAANALTVLRGLRETRCQLRLISFDYTLEPLQFAMTQATALGYLEEYEPKLSQLITAHKATFNDGEASVQWDLQLADFPALLMQPLSRQLPKPHAIMFDAFSLAANPAMWTQPLFANLHQLLDPDRACALPTYSRSTLLRVTLLLAGFFVGIGHATGEKEETTIAANTLTLLPEPLGCRWLERARRSTSAEPLWEPRYQQSPLTPATWERLKRHPQFV